MRISKLTARQLLEIDACTRCGECLRYCPIYTERQEEGINPRGKIQAIKRFIRSQYGLWARIFGPKKLDEDQIKKFSEMVYRCTLCGECGSVCPVSIHSKELWMGLREVLVESGNYPREFDTLKKNVLTHHNISGLDNEGRTEWLESMGGVPEHRYQKEKAEVIYFVGCVASYFPMVHKIPQGMINILNRSQVDFALLGGEEWCCGFPLIGAGMRKEADEVISHNLEALRKREAHTAIFTCPSCFHTWKEEYRTEIRLFHFTEFLLTLIQEGKIQFKEERIKVTYHDPCDLGRASGIYDPPRAVLRSIPGVELVELRENREYCRCCGGGGNLEMIDPELSAALAREKIKQIQETGAEVVVTSCQQCIRTIMTTARRMKIPIKALNLTELVLKHMK